MTEEPDTGPVGPEKDAGTKAGRDLLDRMDRYDGLWHGAVQDIIAIEREAAALAEPSAGGGGTGSGHTAVSAPPDDDPVGRILEDIKRLTIADLRRLQREIDRLLRR